MGTDLPRAPVTNDQKYLAALVAGVRELNDLLRNVLGRDGQRAAQGPDDDAAGGAVQRRKVSEPGPVGPRGAQPVAEPDRGRGAELPAASPPERPGVNAPRAAWVAYAQALGVTTRDGASRAEIAAAIDAAAPPPKRTRR